MRIEGEGKRLNEKDASLSDTPYLVTLRPLLLSLVSLLKLELLPECLGGNPR